MNLKSKGKVYKNKRMLLFTNDNIIYIGTTNFRYG